MSTRQRRKLSRREEELKGQSQKRDMSYSTRLYRPEPGQRMDVIRRQVSVLDKKELSFFFFFK